MASQKVLQEKNLASEVRMLRSFVMSMVHEDKEGKYRRSFVKEMLKAVKEKPTHVFKDKETFLKELE